MTPYLQRILVAEFWIVATVAFMGALAELVVATLSYSRAANQYRYLAIAVLTISAASSVIVALRLGRLGADDWTMVVAGVVFAFNIGLLAIVIVTRHLVRRADQLDASK